MLASPSSLSSWSPSSVSFFCSQRLTGSHQRFLSNPFASSFLKLFNSTKLENIKTLVHQIELLNTKADDGKTTSIHDAFHPPSLPRFTSVIPPATPKAYVGVTFFPEAIDCS
ncbi:hypothetical protein L2E82_26096 [Cichorium intybus]|uniref:Uncharacterized protein n=1 Tax=Cichorium intybus TaxID=13427 RepID=A0ACB9E5F7_CICIN|nr:hypothetical protein L2E82_26096 [Cichorium intybus]